MLEMDKNFKTGKMSSLRELKFGFEKMLDKVHESVPVVFDNSCFEVVNDEERCFLVEDRDVMSIDWVQTRVHGAVIGVGRIVKTLGLVHGMMHEIWKENGLFNTREKDFVGIGLEILDEDLTEHYLLMDLIAEYRSFRRVIEISEYRDG